MGSHYWFLFGDRNGRRTLQSGAETYGIVFSTTEPASSQKHTHIRSEQCDWLHISNQERIDQISHKSIYHVNITRGLLHAHIIYQPFRTSSHPHLFATPPNSQTAFLRFPRLRVLLSENAAEDYSSMIIDLKHLACLLLFTAHMAIIC